jgi:hypothetical protein
MGFAAGFQVGAQAVERAEQRKREKDMRDALAQESGRYGVTEGAYGPGLQENIQQLQGLREQDPAQAPAYDQAIAELTRRQGLTAADYSVASGPTNFATRQEARQAAAPLRTEGLAGVYRQYGDIAKADELEARAFDQQRAIAREARDVQAFKTQQAAAEQQGLLTDAQLTDIQRKQNLQAALDARLADINTQTYEKPEMRTQAVLSLVEELQGPQAAAQLRASYSQNELNEISLQAKKFDEGFRQSRAKGVIPALEWFDEQNTSFKLERDPKNPFRVIQVNTDGTRSVFADAKNERELGMIVDAKAKPGGFLELAKYDLDVKKADAAIASEKAKAGYYAQGGRQTPVMLVNDKGEPTPVYMDRLPVVNGVVQLPQGLRMPKDVQQATAAQNRAYEMLTKSDAWERAERAGDTATMNKLMINRGLDPAQFGGTGMMGWGEQGSTATQTAASGQPAQQSMAAPARAPSAGLMTPQQLAAAQQQQQAQTQEQQQTSVAAGVRAGGLGREAYMLRQEAAGYTPTIIQQMTPRQADEFRRRYGQYLTPEQVRAVNQAM